MFFTEEDILYILMAYGAEFKFRFRNIYTLVLLQQAADYYLRLNPVLSSADYFQGDISIIYEYLAVILNAAYRALIIKRYLFMRASYPLLSKTCNPVFLKLNWHSKLAYPYA